MGFQYLSPDVKPPFAVEGRRPVEVTHLALLGVKIAETAFWVLLKEKQPVIGCFFEFARLPFVPKRASKWDTLRIKLRIRMIFKDRLRWEDKQTR